MMKNKKVVIAVVAMLIVTLLKVIPDMMNTTYEEYLTDNTSYEWIEIDSTIHDGIEVVEFETIGNEYVLYIAFDENDEVFDMCLEAIDSDYLGEEMDLLIEELNEAFGFENAFWEQL